MKVESFMVAGDDLDEKLNACLWAFVDDAFELAFEWLTFDNL